MTTYPLPEGVGHREIRDRARFLRRYHDYSPANAFRHALGEWNRNRLLLLKVQPPTGLPYVVRMARR